MRMRWGGHGKPDAADALQAAFCYQNLAAFVKTVALSGKMLEPPYADEHVFAQLVILMQKSGIVGEFIGNFLRLLEAAHKPLRQEFRRERIIQRLWISQRLLG